MARRDTPSTRRNLTSSVVDRATARDVLSLAGFPPPDRSGFILCPKHDERSPSFHVLERGYFCFGCGDRGGILDLVVTLGVTRDRASAARWLEESIGHD
jgi:hypothetical protein